MPIVLANSAPVRTASPASPATLSHTTRVEPSPAWARPQVAWPFRQSPAPSTPVRSSVRAGLTPPSPA